MELILWIGFYFMTFYAFLPALISRIFGFRVFMRGQTDKEIALTFDDGPDPVYTPQLLDLLKRYGATGTFFLVGSHAEKHPEIVARIHREGHDIGIHNYVHHSNWFMRPKTVTKQILRTSDVIYRITGQRPKYYRPPWGIVNLFDFRRLGHLQIVLWTSIFGDWRARLGADKLYKRMRAKLKPGEVFVLHDCGRTFGADEHAPAQMIAALQRILEDGKRENYRFVGIAEMVQLTERNKKGKGAAATSDTPIEHDMTTLASRPDTNETPDAPVGKPVHRIGPVKRAIVGLWMLWESCFHVLFRLKPVGNGQAFNYRIRKYTGQPVLLKDGQQLRSGDCVMEMHFENKILFEMGMSSRSTVHTAIRLLREVERAIPDLARVLEEDPRGDKVKALYGISMIHRGADGLGFQTFDLPKGLFAKLTNLYLRILLSVIHPDGRKHVRKQSERLSPKIIVMAREDLLKWKDRSVKNRVPRLSRAESQPAAGSLAPLVDAGFDAEQA